MKIGELDIIGTYLGEQSVRTYLGSSLILPTVTVSGTWNPSLTDKNKKVIISGEVTLTGKTDCYSLTFASGGHLTINAGARLRVWEGGIVNNDCNNVNYLTIDFGYSIAGIGGEPPQLLIHPNVVVNNTPKATIRVGQYHVGKSNEYYWQRWGILINQLTSWTKEGPEQSYPIHAFVWDYENNDWKQITALSEMKKFIGVLTTPGNNYPVDFTIIYEDNLLNNQNYEIQSHNGWNLLVNSYLGKINLTKFMEQSQALDSVAVYLREPNTPVQDIDFEHNTYYVYPGQCFNTRVSQPMGALVFDYKNMVWDPSFEEEVTPTRGLMKGAKSEPMTIDDSIAGSTILKNPEPPFDDIKEPATK